MKIPIEIQSTINLTVLRYNITTNNPLHYLYRDWRNNFLTSGAFAEYYDIPHQEAIEILAYGRRQEQNFTLDELIEANQ